MGDPTDGKVTAKTKRPTMPSAVGRAGEFLAAYLLESWGVECHHVDRAGSDLWCKLVDGRLVRVQVKTASGPFGGKSTKRPAGRYRFFVSGSRELEWFCFVALDLGLMRMLRSSEVVPQGTLTLTAEEFTEEKQRADIERMLRE